MSELKSLKNPPKTDADGDVSYDRSNYGYGTSIHLNEKQLQKLDIETPLEAGTEVMVMAKGIVDSSGESVSLINDEDGDGKSMHMNIQLTDMSIEASEKKEDAANILYGKGDKDA